MKMKQRFFGGLAVFAAIASTASPTFANGKYSGGKYRSSAEATGSGGGSAGGDIFSGRGQVYTSSNGNVLTRADVNPLYATGAANGNSRVHGGAVGHQRADMVMGSGGSSEVIARVGRHGLKVRATADGMTDTIAVASGGRSVASVSGSNTSRTSAFGLNTGRGGLAGFDADNVAEGRGYAAASGRKSASSAVNTRTASSAKGYVKR